MQNVKFMSLEYVVEEDKHTTMYSLSLMSGETASYYLIRMYILFLSFVMKLSLMPNNR